MVSTYEYNHVHQQYEKAIKGASEANLQNLKAEGQKLDPYAWFDNMKSVANSITYKNIDSWSNQLMNTHQYGEPFLRFTLTAIIPLGAVLKLSYQAYGMAGLPIYLIKGTKSLEAESDEINGTIASVRDELR